MKSRSRVLLVALCAASVAALALFAACGSDDSDLPADTGGQATASPGGGATPLPGTGETCVPGQGPPQEGEAEGLEGQIVYVRLVFGCQPDIYIMEANGDNARPLAADASIDDESDLSPDGTKVVFFSGREGNAFLYTVNVDGSGLQQITSGQGGDTSPRWSPDGSQIAFSRSGAIAVMNADGSGLRTLMEPIAGESPPCRAGSFVGGWSPDGQNIVYYSAIIRASGDNSFWICTIGLDGGEPVVLVDEPGLHAEPHWSPDGDRIVYRDDVGGSCGAAQAEGCNYDIFVIDVETREKTNVTNHPAFDIEPVWSPDGEWILFASNRDDPNFDLYVIRPDGSGLQRVLHDPDSKDSYPSWR